jgi:hypothetical protein
MDWTDLAQEKKSLRAFANAVMNFRIQKKNAEEFCD